ncbi:MAG: Type III restriction-modification system methylation subunit (EC 2.1.1.72) [Olavius algarvensis Gamma 1 endosymbiont]|nr:MAG: Type III restriction-modification system methylation subunit (EC 2.1.1.72) [Olavius algarvensis Gamma 1 endosymbiont]
MFRPRGLSFYSVRTDGTPPTDPTATARPHVSHHGSSPATIAAADSRQPTADSRQPGRRKAKEYFIFLMPASRQPVSKPAHAGRLLIFIEVFFEDYFVIFNELVFVGNVFSFKLEIGIYSIAGCQLSGSSYQPAPVPCPLPPACRQTGPWCASSRLVGPRRCLAGIRILFSYDSFVKESRVVR